jgi:hypothetical protein
LPLFGKEALATILVVKASRMDVGAEHDATGVYGSG